MSFYQRLIHETQDARAALLSRPIIGETLRGEVTLARYRRFLTQAYHHVKHTVPLLMACGSRLPPHCAWLQKAMAEYIDEEIGHEQWILSDLAHCDADPAQVAAQKPALATEMMVAYAYHQIDRGNPMAFFGMVLVLEGTSTALATQAAGLIQQKLGLPDGAFSYLRSHGELDISHVSFFEGLMNKVDSDADQQAIIEAARAFYHLYGEVLAVAAEEAADA